MSRADFFAGLQKKLSDDALAKAAKQSESDKFISAAIAEMKPLLRDYMSDLDKMGIQVQAHGLDDDGNFISFKMFYEDGGHGGFVTRGHCLVQLFTDDDGKNYSSESPNVRLDGAFKTAKFESFVKQCIEDFIFYADRHGGVAGAR